jgi:hypothetical protein
MGCVQVAFTPNTAAQLKIFGQSPHRSHHVRDDRELDGMFSLNMALAYMISMSAIHRECGSALVLLVVFDIHIYAVHTQVQQPIAYMCVDCILFCMRACCMLVALVLWCECSACLRCGMLLLHFEGLPRRSGDAPRDPEHELRCC